MADRDSNRIVIECPSIDFDGDGAADVSAEFNLCVHSGPNWSGFTKEAVNTTCSSDTLDNWGNLIETYRAGTLIDFGEVSFGVDWDPDSTTEGGKELGAFYSRVEGNWEIRIPANIGETTGPILVIPAVCTGFTPKGTVRSAGEEARFGADLTLKITGAISITAAV